MQTSSYHHPLHYHTWKDIGGPIGLLLDGAFFLFVMISAGFMLVFCTALLCLDYALKPVLGLLARIRRWGNV